MVAFPFQALRQWRLTNFWHRDKSYLLFPTSRKLSPLLEDCQQQSFFAQEWSSHSRQPFSYDQRKPKKEARGQGNSDKMATLKYSSTFSTSFTMSKQFFVNQTSNAATFSLSSLTESLVLASKGRGRGEGKLWNLACTRHLYFLT